MRFVLLFLALASLALAFENNAAWVEIKVVDSFGRPVQNVYFDICCDSKVSSTKTYYTCTYGGETGKAGIAYSRCVFCLAGETAEIKAHYGSKNYSGYVTWSGSSTNNVPAGCYAHDLGVPHHDVAITLETTNLYVHIHDAYGQPFPKIPVDVLCPSYPLNLRFHGITDENGTAVLKQIPKYTNCKITVESYKIISYQTEKSFSSDEEILNLTSEGSGVPLTIKLEDRYENGLDGYVEIKKGSSYEYMNITNGSIKIFLPKGNYTIKAFYFYRMIGEKSIVLENAEELLFIANESGCEGLKNFECGTDRKYCYFGTLKNNCKKCGCSAGYYCTESPQYYGGVCCKLGEYYDGSRCVEGDAFFTVYYVPININPNDDEFLNLARSQGEFLAVKYGLPMSSVKIVNETMYASDDDCGLFNRIDVWSVDNFFKEWYAKKTGFIEGMTYTTYRVLGYDKLNTCSTDFCGYTQMRSHAAYLSGLQCSQYYAVSAHEIGHTFWLCDTYNPLTWDVQNSLLKTAFRECPNEKPTPKNSECIDCPLSGVCCCGITLDNYTCDIMGSADSYDKEGIPIARAFTEREYNWIRSRLEEMR